MTEHTPDPGQTPPAPSGYEAAPPPPPAPSYTPGYAAAPPATARGTNALAVVTLVAGIAGLTVVPFIGSIIAVITGPLADKQIATTGEDGAQLSKIGKILGWVGIALGVVGILAIIFFVVIFAAAGAGAA